jgi:HEAT repeat protein
MPLIRKPTTGAAAATPDTADVLQNLASASPDERWTAARDAVSVIGGAAALAAALRVETEPHIREAMFTGLARVGTSESTDLLLSLLRSDQSALRTGALDGLRMMGTDVRHVLPRLLSDPDADIRILSSELARALPADEATTVLCALLAGEQDVNVCAAAVDVLAEVGNPAARPVLAQCAARFPQNAFLAFAVRVAIDRISSDSERARD